MKKKVFEIVFPRNWGGGQVYEWFGKFYRVELQVRFTTLSVDRRGAFALEVWQ